MPIRFTCPNPHCGKESELPDGMAGQRAYCPFCGSSQMLPSVDVHAETVAEEPGSPGVLSVAAMPEAEQPTQEAPYRRHRPMMPGERERIIRAQQDTWGRRAVVLGILAAVLLVGWFVYSRASLFFAKHRIEELLHKAARDKSTQADAEELARRLPLVVSHCNDLYESKPADELLPLTRGLQHVLPDLPNDTDLTPLLGLTEKAGMAHATAVRVVQQRASRAWLIERSCRGRERARKFAIEALRPAFPLGELADEDIEKLIQRTSVVEKKNIIEEVRDAVHRRLEERWVGRYKLHVAAAWQFPRMKATKHSFISEAAPAEVTCQDRIWRVKLRDSEWSGTVDELEKLSVSRPLSRLADPGLAVAPFNMLPKAKVSVRFRKKNGFVASVGPVPRFRDTQTGATPADSPSRIPRGAMILGKAIGSRMGLPTPVIRWVLPAKAGFTAFETKLVRQD